VSLEVARGEILGLVGESGCGKSTIGALLTLLERPDRGSVVFEGRDVTRLCGQALRAFRRRVQIVFQDPYESLDPRCTVEDTLTEPLIVHGIGSNRGTRADRVRRTLERVELRPPEAFLRRYPHDLSGGQRQRVAIARAVVLEPDFLVADEPVSMLDVSVRAGVLNLMKRLKDELSMTYLFITHDLAVARYMCDRLAVMYLGKIVETGQTEHVLRSPAHPYAQLLLSAVPAPDPDLRRPPVFSDCAVPDASDIPTGCRFHPRCSHVMGVCRDREPGFQAVADGHHAACFLHDARVRGQAVVAVKP
jgi:peptide/nickel transport system ATP-binding protein